MDVNVPKPVNPTELYDTIEQLTASSPGRRGTPISRGRSTHGTDTDTNPAVDWNAALNSTGGDRELLTDVVEQALLEMTTITAQLQNFLREENWSRWRVLRTR